MFGDSIATYLLANAAATGAFVVVGMLIFRQHRWRGFVFGLFLGFTIGPILVDAALVETTSDPGSGSGQRHAPSPIKLR